MADSESHITDSGGTNLESQFDKSDYYSKLVMLRAERNDEITITDVKSSIHQENRVPESAVVIQRTDTYFGPKLILESSNQTYLLTAPGPNNWLQLWTSYLDDARRRTGWSELVEVSARLAENLPRYEYCPQCGQTLKTVKHEIQAELGCCPRIE